MQLKIFRWLLLPLLALPLQGQSVPDSFRPLSLQDCIRLALLHNRELQIQRFEPEIARLTLDASYGYYDPRFTAETRRDSISSSGQFDPTDLSGFRTYDAVSHTVEAGIAGILPSGMSYRVSGDYAKSYGSRNDEAFDSFNASVNVSVSQPLLRNFWIDSARRSIRINKKNLKITELGVDYVTMDVITSVQQAYYDLLFARDNALVQEKLREVRQRFYDETKRKVEVGTLPPLEERLAQSQVSTVQADLISAKNNVVLAENILKTLIGDDFVSSSGMSIVPTEGLVVVPETLDKQESWRRGLNERPDLLQMRIDVEKMEIEEKYWYNQNFPSFDIVAGYGRSGASRDIYVAGGAFRVARASFSDTLDQIEDGRNPSDFIGAVFSIPLSRITERSNLKAARQRKSQAILRVKQFEELVLRQIDDAIQSARTALERVTATREATEYAKSALEAHERKLAAGTVTAYEVLQLQSDLAAAQSAEIRARADYNKALSLLHFYEGTTLERNNLAVEIE